MPRITLPISETAESVHRPVVLSVTRDLMKHLGLSENTRILFNGPDGKAVQYGSTIDRSGKDTTIFPGTGLISIDAQEEFTEDHLMTQVVQRPEQKYIFLDKALETWMRPSYGTTDLTINIRHRALDRVAAQAWRDLLKTRISAAGQNWLHELKYYYLIPEEYIVILKEIHRLRETVEPYGDDWNKYLTEHSTTNLSALTNLSGEHSRYGISQSQMRVQGYFDFSGVPEKGEKDDGQDTWTITISYKLRYEKPIACEMGYPLMIHNQLIGDKFRTSPEEQPPYNPDHRIKSFNLSGEAFAMFESDTPIKQLRGNNGYTIPPWDEFIPESIIGKTQRIYTSLIGIDTPPNQRVLLKLDEVDENLVFDPVVLALLKKEYRWITMPYQSIFQLSLYQGPRLLKAQYLEVDENLVVTTNVDLPLREYYHIRLSMVKDFSLLSKEAQDRLREEGQAVGKIVESIDPNLKGMPCTLNGSYIPKGCWDKVTDALSGRTDKNVYQFNTVQTLMIEAGPYAGN